MINRIIKFSVQNRLLVFIATGALAVFGVKAFQALSIDAVPDITNTQVQINTPVDGLIPEEIERMITFPIEYVMNGMPGVETVRSISRYGISQVTVVFDEGFDIYRARQLVSERLQTIELPENVMPQMGPISTGLGEIVHYSVEAKQPSQDPEERLQELMELRSIQEWQIKPRLLTTKGVTEVNTIGGFEKQFFVQPNIPKMTQYGIHFDDIEQSISQTNVNVGGSYIQQTGEQLLVRGIGLLKGIEDIENVVVKQLSTLKVIRVKDIATVKLDKEIRTGAATVNGEESIIGTTFMLLGENSRTVSIRVVEQLDEIKKTLPKWVEINVLYDRSTMVNSTLGTVEHNLLLGASLVIIILMLLVGNLRAALITAIVIPLSLLITFILMKWRGVSGNLMSLGALDFGIIVDGAVIVVENCVRRIHAKGQELKRDLSRQEVKQEVIDASIEIRQAAGFGEMIVIVVFIPLLVLTGVEGKMFVPMAQTFIMALASALFLSFTLVPALSATIMSGKVRENKTILMRVTEKLFQPVLKQALRFKYLVMSIGIASIFGGVFLFSQMGSEFIPKLDEGDFAVQFIRPANISTQNSVDLQRISEKVIKSFPEVKDVFARTGAAEVATDPMGVNISDSYVMLNEKNKWSGSIQSKKELIEAVRKKLELTVPGQTLLISQPVELRFNELLEGTRAEVSAKIYGDDLDLLIDYSKDLANVLSQVPGVGEAESESSGKAPMLQYSPKQEVLSQLGVSDRPVLDVIETALGGREIGSIYEGVKRYPIIARLSGEERKDLKTIRTLPVGISEGYTVPIEKVATIDYVETFSSVSRENSQRRVAVLINPETRDIEGFVKKAQKLADEQIKLPEGYFIEWGGSFKNLQTAKERLKILIPLALLAILMMIYFAFQNIGQVLLIFFCAPMSLIGGVLALKFMGMPFSISAGVGFIALSGISILNGVVLVTYFNTLRAQGLSVDEVVHKGTMVRLRPVLMTALIDIFGFLPMMLSTGLGAEVQRPLATVVVVGMFLVTILTLVVLPCLYSVFSRFMVQRGI
ncbi:MAG TPA: CusA/CzcA family heavy metal efflux RND transporter [Oligoflexia bacterium]|nr:CusA/CzcA family heavy metal efflux RND transporter [bacterium]HMQ11356.1 CusA/CzcA family heavy metal efflux RND transporter [Oligoflexia bacterium]HMR24078.1 CusA/CzcA family heavy metal efflux RND transporter [Oligoflexia bacterium]